MPKKDENHQELLDRLYALPMHTQVFAAGCIVSRLNDQLRSTHATTGSTQWSPASLTRWSAQEKADEDRREALREKEKELIEDISQDIGTGNYDSRRILEWAIAHKNELPDPGL